MIEKIKKRLLDTDIPVQNVMFHLLIAGTIVAGIGMELLTVLLRSDINKKIEVLILVYLVILLWYSLKIRHSLQMMITVVCVSAAFLVFPLLFLSNGGVHGGMAIWMVLGMVLEFMLLERRYLLVLAPVTAVAYGVVFWLANQKPEIIVQFKSETLASLDVFTSLLAVAAIIGMLARMQMRFYTKKCDQLEQAVQEVERSNQAERRFLANMSHEIRTPVSVICGMDEMILRECDDQEIVSYANEIKVASRLLLSTINDILDFSKIESGKMELQITEYSLSRLIADIYHLMDLKMQEKKLQFAVKVDSELPDRLYGDDVRLRQILLNIVNNAYKYTSEGQVTINCNGFAEGNIAVLRFSVEDTGAGIREEDIQRLFSEFRRIDELKNRNVEGSGLGMNIAMQLLVMMGSRLQVESVYGKGSTFYFTIKQRIADRKPVGEIRYALRHSGGEHQYHEMFHAPEACILVVDDNEINRRVFVKLLERTCMQIDEAGGGEACLEMIRNKKYDVIFMDHMMPGMDGIETFRRIRQGDSICRDVPVVILTANVTLEHRDIYEEEGFNDYLSKPVEPERLEYVILRLLDKNKVTYMMEDIAGNEEEKLQNDIRLPAIEGVFWKKALEKFHSKETVFAMAKVFYGTLSGEAAGITSLYEEEIDHEEGMKNYRIRVHGLKSAAASVGAMRLSGIARSLEEAAIQRNTDQIKAIHPMLIREIKILEERMREMFPEEEKYPWEEHIDLKALLGKLCEAMQRDDIDGADAVVEELKQYTYEESLQAPLEELFVMVANLEYKRVSELAAQIDEKIGALQIK